MTKKKLKIKSFFVNVNKYFYLVLALFVLLIITPFLIKTSPGDPCANSISCVTGLKGTIDTTKKEGIFMNKKIKIPNIALSLDTTPKTVLGTDTSTKHIYIDLTNQRLFAMENDHKVMEFLISSGKWGKTPVGAFTTWVKVRATRMTGGNKNIGTYYDLPNVPYTMFFYNKDIPKSRGFGIHGAYWHNNFGHPMSHGCINLSVENAKTLYDWANPPTDKFSVLVNDQNPGTAITIYGTAPLN